MCDKSKKQIIKLILSEITGNFGSSILAFIIGLGILKNTDSVLNFGFSQIIGPLIAVVLLPFVGSITDKYNKKAIVITAQMFSIVSLFIYSQVITDNLSENLIYTYFLIVSLKITDKFLTNSLSAGIAQILMDKDVQKYKSISQVISPLIGIFSPLISAFLYSKLSIVSFVYIEIVIELITMLIVFSIDFKFVEKEKNENIENSGLIKLFKEGIKFVSKSKILVFMLFFSSLLNLIFSSMGLGLPVVLVKQLKFTDNMYGITMSSFSIGMILSGIILSTIQKEIENPVKKAVDYVILSGFCMVFLGVILIFNFSIRTYFILFILINLAMSFLMVLINIPIGVWLVKAVSVEYQGRVFSILDTIGQILTPIGILFYSFLFENVSSGLIYTINGIVTVILCIIIPMVFKVDLNTNKI